MPGGNDELYVCVDDGFVQNICGPRIWAGDKQLRFRGVAGWDVRAYDEGQNGAGRGEGSNQLPSPSQ